MDSKSIQQSSIDLETVDFSSKGVLKVPMFIEAWNAVESKEGTVRSKPHLFKTLPLAVGGLLTAENLVSVFDKEAKAKLNEVTLEFFNVKFLFFICFKILIFNFRLWPMAMNLLKSSFFPPKIPAFITSLCRVALIPP